MEKTEQNPLLVSSANLAYLGDCVYELCVRKYLVEKNVKRPSVESLRYVTAHVQSSVLEKILPILTEEETDVYKRGRNAHTARTGKEYHRATGLETLFGYLYLKGDIPRVRELFEICME